MSLFYNERLTVLFFSVDELSYFLSSISREWKSKNDLCMFSFENHVNRMLFNELNQNWLIFYFRFCVYPMADDSTNFLLREKEHAHSEVSSSMFTHFSSCLERKKVFFFFLSIHLVTLFLFFFSLSLYL